MVQSAHGSVPRCLFVEVWRACLALRTECLTQYHRVHKQTRGLCVAYKKPTLSETFAELHLAAGTLTEARFFDVVPRLRELGFSEVEFTTVGLSLDIRQGRPFPREKQRVRCWKPDKKELVQVGEDLVVVNLMGDYPGWDAFMRLFDQSVTALKAGLGQTTVQSLNLITTDNFEIPAPNFSVSDYLAVGGKVVPNWYTNTSQSLDLNMGRGLLEPDGKNRQIQIHVHAANDPVRIILVAQFHDRLTREDELNTVLSRLHEESNATFESLITDRVRTEVMQGHLK